MSIPLKPESTDFSQRSSFRQFQSALATSWPSPLLCISQTGGIGDWKQTATPYSGGTAFNIPNGFAANLFVNEFSPSGIDVGFRTYVDTDVAAAPVPEPATLSLLGLG